MRLFDRYIAVDWSAANTPSRPEASDSIWIAEVALTPTGQATCETVHMRTRHAAMVHIRARLMDARAHGWRVFAGFDFPFGYPQGGARRIGAGDDWQALWTYLAAHVVDGEDNRSNRFSLAADINHMQADSGHLYWGRPAALNLPHLLPGKAATGYGDTHYKRRAEALSSTASPVWQLYGNGSVGGQAMLGIARLEQLRRDAAFAHDIAVWPFETDFERDLSRPVILAEIYPSIFARNTDISPKDKAQVIAVATTLASFDSAGRLSELLAFPDGQDPSDRRIALAEEGWIVGESAIRARRKEKLAPPTPRRIGAWASNPDNITADSFAIIAAEARLEHLPASLRPIASRMIHACGMVEIAPDIAGHPGLPAAVSAALDAGAPILCDCEAVRAGISRKIANTRVVTLSDPQTAARAESHGITRSAAAVDLWQPQLDGAIVVIGNAPTALFRLLDLLAGGAPRPAAIIATPVGFVGAAESKAALAAEAGEIPYITLAGRRGGSAIAAAALNAVVLGDRQ